MKRAFLVTILIILALVGLSWGLVALDSHGVDLTVPEETECICQDQYPDYNTHGGYEGYNDANL